MQATAGQQLVLMTVHRRENYPYMEAIYRAVAAGLPAQYTVMVPVHPNPHATRAAQNFCQNVFVTTS